MNDVQWFTLEEAESMPARQRLALTRRHYNPGMARMFGLLGFDRLWGISADGAYITLEDGRRILDITGGNCVLGLGHNHPRILAARKRVADARRLELCKSFLSPYTAALAANMAAILPGDLEISFFCNSGAEANEGALKMAQKHHGRQRRGIVYMNPSFHGKTHAAMSISSMDHSRDHFLALEQCYQVPYGDADALATFLQSRCDTPVGRPDICAVILESIHGTRLLFPPEGYLRQVREICTQYDVLMIIDEIYVGLGRAGSWFAFQSEDIVPDIVTYSKTLGGGKATIAGYTARRDIFLKAYGSPGDSMMHSTTFAGMTEECATAIEALNVIRDDKLVERACTVGAHLERRLKALWEKHPGRILDVRGRGLLWGVEIKPALHQLEPVVQKLMAGSTVMEELTGAIVLSELFHRHNVLAYLGFARRNLVVFSPALTILESDLDMAVDALDRILSTPWPVLGTRFLSHALLT